MHTSGALQLNKVMMFGSDDLRCQMRVEPNATTTKKLKGLSKRTRMFASKFRKLSSLKNVFNYS